MKPAPHKSVTVTIHGRTYHNIRADRAAEFKRRIRAIDAAESTQPIQRYCKSLVLGHMQTIDRNR